MKKIINNVKKHKKLIMPVLCIALAIVLVVGINPSAQATVPYTHTMVNPASATTMGIFDVSSSKDGRYVAYATNYPVLPMDTNTKIDVYVKDNVTGTNALASQTAANGLISLDTNQSKISYDGRYVVFTSAFNNVVSGDNNSAGDVFLRDLQLGTTELISVSTSGGVGNSWSGKGDISRDGRYVVFESIASNLVSGDTNNKIDIFVRDRVNNTTTRVSTDTNGNEGNDTSRAPSISCDGAIIAFNSGASNLVSGDTNNKVDTFVVNRVGGFSIKNITLGGTGHSMIETAPAVSCDGSTVAFMSNASNLVSGDSNSRADIFTYDTFSETREAISKSSSGTFGNDNSGDYKLGVSADGRYVTFSSWATNLVSGDTNSKIDIFLRDRKTQTTEIVSKRDALTQTTDHSEYPTISPDGSRVLYISRDSGLVSGDTNGTYDVFMSETGVTPCAL